MAPRDLPPSNIPPTVVWEEPRTILEEEDPVVNEQDRVLTPLIPTEILPQLTEVIEARTQNRYNRFTEILAGRIEPTYAEEQHLNNWIQRNHINAVVFSDLTSLAEIGELSPQVLNGILQELARERQEAEELLRRREQELREAMTAFGGEQSQLQYEDDAGSEQAVANAEELREAMADFGSERELDRYDETD